MTGEVSGAAPIVWAPARDGTAKRPRTAPRRFGVCNIMVYGVEKGSVWPPGTRGSDRAQHPTARVDGQAMGACNGRNWPIITRAPGPVRDPQREDPARPEGRTGSANPLPCRPERIRSARRTNRQLGRITPSMTWITPLAAGTSVRTTFTMLPAPSVIVTDPSLMFTVNMLPSTVVTI